eukprot:14072830-Alexandrium_andersonii.AAC.1
MRQPDGAAAEPGGLGLVLRAQPVPVVQGNAAVPPAPGVLHVMGRAVRAAVPLATRRAAHVPHVRRSAMLCTHEHACGRVVCFQHVGVRAQPR